MLDALDQVNWDQLSHAYGEATDVPDLLRAVASDQKEVCDKAIYEFYGNIWHQGTVYEATAHAVPFLVELLTVPGVLCKAQILGLLQALASGSSYLDVHQRGDENRTERRTDEFQAKLQCELSWVRAAHEAVVEGTPTYLDLLCHPDVSVRLMAPYVLERCVARAQEIEPALRERLATENDPKVRASIVRALGHFWRDALPETIHQPSSGSRELLGDGIALARQQIRVAVAQTGQLSVLGNLCRDHAESPVVRLVAALCAVELGGVSLVDDALPVIRETAEECRGDFSELPWFEGASPLTPVSKALAPNPHVRLHWLLEMLGHRNPALRKDAVWELVQLCHERRSAPQSAVPHLVKLVADPVPDVRKWAAGFLPELGQARQLAVEPLEEFLDHPDAEVRALAAETLEHVRASRDEFDLKHWLGKPKLRARVSKLIAILEEKGTSRYQNDQIECADAVAALEFAGPSALDAVPTLGKALNHEYQWIRVRAARALWKITNDADEALPVLLEELQCRPTGLLAADCLGEMGCRAQSAVPILRQIIDSEVRLVRIGSVSSWVDQDEAFVEAARRALDRIQRDSGTSIDAHSRF